MCRNTCNACTDQSSESSNFMHVRKTSIKEFEANNIFISHPIIWSNFNLTMNLDFKNKNYLNKDSENMKAVEIFFLSIISSSWGCCCTRLLPTVRHEKKNSTAPFYVKSDKKVSSLRKKIQINAMKTTTDITIGDCSVPLRK